MNGDYKQYITDSIFKLLNRSKVIANQKMNNAKKAKIIYIYIYIYIYLFHKSREPDWNIKEIFQYTVGAQFFPFEWQYSRISKLFISFKILGWRSSALWQNRQTWSRNGRKSVKLQWRLRRNIRQWHLADTLTRGHCRFPW